MKPVAQLACFLLLCLALSHEGRATPLDDYVNRPDPTYKYDVLSQVKGPGYTLYTINMTSQTWMPDIQSMPVWYHYMTITVPDVLKVKDAAFMFIEGGHNGGAPPAPSEMFVQLTTVVAATTGTIGCNLMQIPNEPITFHADPQQKRRTEDAIIAWTWKQFILSNGSNPEILLRMPMTKAGVRALDTIDIFAQKLGVTTGVKRFLVAGASKRGWTTWTVGAVDKRVIAIAPIVMDLLNFVQNTHHYFRSLGGWTFAFSDYYELNFTQELDNPGTQRMADVIDPLSYTDRFLNKPKYIISTGGDEFFMIDDARYFLDKLKGETHLRMIPNCEHSIAGHATSLMFSIRAFYLSVLMGKPRPKMTWNLDYTSTGGKITMMTDTVPSTVHSWHATTLDGIRKDFRLLRGTPGDPSKPQVHPVIWLRTEVKSLGNNTYSVEFDNPSLGWRAFFIQVSYPGLEDSVLEFTTQTMIIPDTFPFPECHGEACRGSLV